MQRRALGRTGLRVSRLGLGTMTWSRETDEHEAREQLTTFLDAGGNLVDTAAGYADGALRGAARLAASAPWSPRDDVVIATKAGISRRTGDAGPRHLPRHPAEHPGRLARSGSASTTSISGRCTSGRDETPIEETLAALDHAVSTGRTAYVGISNYNGWQTAQAATWQRAVPGRTPLASTQVEYSLVNRKIEHEVLPAAARPGARGAALVAARPWGADRQVPRRHSFGLARRDHRSSPTSWTPTSTTAAAASSRRRRRPPTGWAGRRCRWPWSGSATGPA